MSCKYYCLSDADSLINYIPIWEYSHCKNKRVVLTQLGYLSCSFSAKECTYKQIS